MHGTDLSESFDEATKSHW